jgi:hypothetical protein
MPEAIEKTAGAGCQFFTLYNNTDPLRDRIL